MRKIAFTAMIFLVMSMFIACRHPLSDFKTSPSQTELSAQTTGVAVATEVSPTIAETPLTITQTPPAITESSLVLSESDSKRLEDLEFLCTTLEEKHPDLYHNISKEAFYSEKEQISANISSWSDIEFFIELKRLIALIGDAHINIFANDLINENLWAFPISLTKIDGNWIIAEIDKPFMQYVGYQLVAMNDVPIEEVYTRAEKIITHENGVWLEAKFITTIYISNILKYIKVIEDLHSITLTVQDMKTGEDETVEMQSLQANDFYNVEWVSNQYPSTGRSKESNRAMALDTSTYFIQCNTCVFDVEYPIGKLMTQINDDLTSNEYTKVIVDLRYNAGGRFELLQPVISKLRALQKQTHFQIYTLIGHNTFSAAVYNAVDLWQTTDCILVGSPTGGNVNFYANAGFFQLPNSQFSFECSTLYYERLPGYEKDSLYPELSVNVTYEDFIAGIDSEVQAVLEHVVQRK